MQRKDQRTNGNGTANDRRFITWAKTLNSLLILFTAGGISFGGLQITKQDTVDSLANIKMEQALLQKDFDNHIGNLKDKEKLKDDYIELQVKRIEDKIGSIDKRLNRLENNSSDIKKLLEKLVRDSTR